MSETLTMVNPIEPGKIRTHHAKIVVECTTGKPYYSIEWFDTAKQEYYLGYSSYCIDNVLGWLKECFEIVEAHKTNADRIRSMSDEELADLLSEGKWKCENYRVCKECPRYIGDCCLPLEEWLKQPQPEPPKEEAKQDCPYNKNGHCMGQKLMPECDPKNCDRRK